MSAGFDRIDGYLVEMLGMTPSRREVMDLVTRRGHELEPVYGDREFQAQIEPIGDGRYRILYNATHLPTGQMIQVYHELAEILAMEYSPGLFDDDPVMIANYDGNLGRRDMRHLVAVECEIALVTRLRKAGYTIPRSPRHPLKPRPAVPRRTRTHQTGRCHCGCPNTLEMPLPETVSYYHEADPDARREE